MTLNSLRVWAFVQQVVTSIHDDLWTALSPKRTTRILRMWRRWMDESGLYHVPARPGPLQHASCPFVITRDSRRACGWVYAIHGDRGENDYIGCTSRKAGRIKAAANQQPYRRWMDTQPRQPSAPTTKSTAACPCVENCVELREALVPAYGFQSWGWRTTRTS